MEKDRLTRLMRDDKMREISFKGKRKDNGEWIEGYLFDDGMLGEKRMFIGKLVIAPYEGPIRGKWTVIANGFDEVDTNTICEYTGLTDKNGNKIWENDIIQYEDITAPVRFGFHDLGYGFYVDFSRETCLREELGYWRTKVIVIGNMFDNPN